MWQCSKCKREFKNENQQHFCGEIDTIDKYIEDQPEEIRPVLEEIRRVMREAAPKAKEKISWRMPTFWQGENLIHFAAFKKHVGIYPGGEVAEIFSERLKGYKMGKGSIQLPLEGQVDYELIKDLTKWRVAKAESKSRKDGLVIRPEFPEDYEDILRLTYDAFLTLDYPGRRRIDEHYLIYLLKDSPNVLKELCFVAERDGEILGHILYTRGRMTRTGGTEAEVITFGPLSVHPKAHKQGIGKALVLHSMELARELGFGAVLILGVPDYYPKLGFKRAGEYGLTLDDGSCPDAFMVYELKEGYLNGGGVYGTWSEEYEQAEKDDEGFAAFQEVFMREHFRG